MTGIDYFFLCLALAAMMIGLAVFVLFGLLFLCMVAVVWDVIGVLVR